VRRALIAAAVVILSLAPAARAAPARQSLVLPEAVAGRPALVGGTLFYVVRTRRQETVKRLDLATLQVTPAYKQRASSAGLGAVRSGGGRVAVEVDDIDPRGGFGTKVVELDPAGGAPRTVAKGLLRNSRRRNCGTEVRLEDVSQDGALLVDTAAFGCGRRARARHVLRRYAAGPPLPVRRWFDKPNDESGQWRLSAGRLLESNERDVRIGDLAGGATRRIRRSARGFLITWADLDAGGHVVIAELRFRGRTTREIVRVSAPGDPGGQRILLDAHAIQSEPRFCGERLVEQRVSRTNQELLVYDDPAGAPRLAFSTPRQSSDLEIHLACDADTAVLVDYQRARRTVIEVVPLAREAR
jgi:hypothetical protein